MAGIVRLKRRRDEQPAENLLFSCKKRKTLEPLSCGIADVDDTFKTLFKFAGTIDSKEDDLGSVVKKAISKEKLKQSYKQAHSQYGAYEEGRVNSRSRKSKKDASTSARFKVVSDRRVGDWESLDASEEGAAAAAAAEEKGLFLWDVEAEGTKAMKASEEEEADVVTCNGVALTKSKVKAEEYVYDLYYFNKPDFDFRLMENILAVEAFGGQMLVNPGSDDDSDHYDDEDDENDECNWRNDYPDEDPQHYACDELDDDLAYAMHDKLTFGDGEELSDGEIPASSDIWSPSAGYEDYRRQLKAYMQEPF
ncbi:hypothetical protein CAPTEDRAFT_221578 [Capitella teleta]|uniref:Probable RNA polymerase II nuclear localization protein SLC7A6OS n=1 Tax=Capitella teleta TaxID=283909 RepID=R7T6R8_CAPTE|nr:hypothetical protein CAPTEDRAFT_221578 [Capitella teleta]|eukprot:ELT89083.1 hypothetical protein CAPTEDRAFT_221578 [Capitella teleta]